MMHSGLPDVFERRESEVRSYCRSFPRVFDKAKGAFLYDTEGRQYIDFFCGAGAFNYGHNPPALKRALLDYIESDGVAHSLDLATVAKERFLLEFQSTILHPRQLIIVFNCQSERRQWSRGKSQTGTKNQEAQHGRGIHQRISRAQQWRAFGHRRHVLPWRVLHPAG